MYGILGEEDGDVETLQELVRRLRNVQNLSCRLKGFDGFGDLLKSGYQYLNSFSRGGCKRFIICLDADGPDPSPRYREAMDKVVRRADLSQECCVVVPVQEIEAWILADIECVTNIFSSWKPKPIHGNPEAITNPKERLIKESRLSNKRPRYDPSTHNPKLAKYLNLEVLQKRCRSFEKFAHFVIDR